MISFFPFSPFSPTPLFRLPPRHLYPQSVSSMPSLESGYSKCRYTETEYYTAFAKVAPIVKKAFPDIKIHANSALGQSG